MINLKTYLYEKIKPIIKDWDEEGIYAISFFVYSKWSEHIQAIQKRNPNGEADVFLEAVKRNFIW